MATWGAAVHRKFLVTIHGLEHRILRIRGARVMLDSDLAELYGVTVKRLNEQVRRNRERFPGDFMFRLSGQETANLRSQIATSSWGGRRFQPYVFTEQGVAMLSGVLHGQRAIRVNVEIMRAFVRLRAAAAAHHQMEEKMDELGRVVGTHDQSIRAVFAALKRLMSPPYRKKRRIGFLARDRKAARYRAGMT